MKTSPGMADLVAAWRRELVRGLGAGGAQATLRLQVVAEPDGAGGYRLRPAGSGEEAAAGANIHEATVVIDAMNPTSASAGGKASGPAPAPLDPVRSPGPVPLEPTTCNGDRQTLRRRLELVLGGPPGFSTGAKAEVLSDLLKEFGRATLIEEIGRAWITHFDTGPDASQSVRGQ